MGASQTARHYDRLDRLYRQLWGEHVHHGFWAEPHWSPERAVRFLAERVAQAARMTVGDHVVDIGCGYGAPARLWSTAYGVQVTGFTVSEAQFAYAQRQASAGAGPAPDFRLQDILENTLPDMVADAVVAVESLTHIDPMSSVLTEAARLLRPGGRFVACVWLAAPDVPRWAQRTLLDPIVEEGRLAGLPTAETLRERTVDAGLHVERLDDWTAQVRRTWTVVLRRLVGAVCTDASVRRVLFDPGESERVFAQAVPRIWCAQHLGLLRYGCLVARRP